MLWRTLIPSFMLGLLFHGTGHAQTSVEALGGASDAAQGVFDRIGGNTETGTVAPVYSVGGEYPKGMVAYLKENVHYPRSEYDAGIQGKVDVEFVVNKDGHVQNVKVIRGVSPGLDAEAVRAVKSMPGSTSDRMNGEPVSTRYVIPVSFSIPSSASPSKD